MSTMPYEDDPMLTAYALGELDGDDAAEVEQRLANDPEARAWVDGIRGTADRLATALRREPSLARAGAPEAAPGDGAPMRIEPHQADAQQQRRGGGRWPLALAAAATLAALGLTTWGLFHDRVDGPHDTVALNAREDAAPETEVGAQLGARGMQPAPEAEPAAPLALLQDQHGQRERWTAFGQGQAVSREEQDALGSVTLSPPQEQKGPADEAARRLGAMASGGATPARPQQPAADAGYLREGAPPIDDLHLFKGERADIPNRFRDDFHTEQYDRITDNAFLRVTEQPVSTFSVDVDTASYSNMRRFLNAGRLPPPDAVRIEELVNYFDYGYESPSAGSEHPFAAHVAVTEAPWNPEHRLVRIGIKGKEIPVAERPASNLVFLLDVSGSMQPENKLPLVRRAMRMLAEQLDERDRVAIVVYAGGSGVALPSTSGANRHQIVAALDRLEAGGSTNGAEGIQLAYQVARQHFIEGGVNRVILCTDGDFNIGVTDRGQLTRLIEEQAKSGVYLSILGFGMGNLKDATMEELTNKGEGNYGYIDTEHEAQKLLVEQMQGTLQSIAKDVKIQVEFNPAEVGSYRLIGYENRILARQDFNDDTKDAGDIGAGHEVTALYEVVPVEVQAKDNAAELARLRELLKKYEDLQAVAGPTPDGRAPHEAEVKEIRARIEALQRSQPAPPADDLKYQAQPNVTPAAASGELMTVKLRYKAPDAPKEQGTSTLIQFPVNDAPGRFADAGDDVRHAAAVAGMGMLLRDSPYKGSLTWQGLEEMTSGLEELRRGRLSSEGMRRLEFRDLVRRAASLAGQTPAAD